MNQDYIIRSDRAGVFIGEIKEKNGSEVVLANVRKLWSWSGACAVEELAMNGVKNPRQCRFTVTVPEMSVLGVIQLLPCTEAASRSIRAVEDWRA